MDECRHPFHEACARTLSCASSQVDESADLLPATSGSKSRLSASRWLDRKKKEFFEEAVSNVSGIQA